MPAQKQAPEIVVYFNSQIARNARPISASLGSSAESLPEATIEIQPPGRQPGRSELLGLELAQFDQPEVEIAIRTPFGDQIAHWGKVKARHVVMNEGGDAITFISRIEDQHFGRPLRKAYFWDALSNDGVGLDLPTVFNPEDKDGVVKNNLSAKRDKIFKCGLFVDPESTRTEAARKYAGTPEPKAWTLPEAAYYL